MHVPFRLVLILLGAVAAHASAADGKTPAVSPTAVATRSLGINAPAGVSTIAYDVNARGQVAAVLRDEAGRQRGVLFDKGGTTELTPADGKYSDARGINPDGEIIGSASQQDGSWRAFLFDRARGRRELPTLGGPSSYGMGINDAGHAVGFADTAAGEWHAFLYTGGDGMRDLGTLGGRLSSATAINDAGMIVGASETKDHQWHAFVHDGKSMIDLGAIIGYGSSYASDINNAGHVVGTVLVGDERSTFVWRDGKMSVHRGGRSLHLTNAINDAEQVIGATFFLRLNAATMPSDAPPAVPVDPSTPFGKIGMLVLLSGAAFAFRHFTRATTLRSA
jgi:probable HAF family extracellular repeat protein